MQRCNGRATRDQTAGNTTPESGPASGARVWPGKVASGGVLVGYAGSAHSSTLAAPPTCATTAG